MHYEQLIPILHHFTSAYKAVADILNGDIVLQVQEPDVGYEPPEIEDGVVGTRKVMTEASYRRRHLIALAIVALIWIAASFTKVN